MLFLTDVYEDDGELVLEIEAPGVDASKLTLLVGEALVRVESARPAERGRRAWHRRERAAGVFAREIPLPDRVVSRLADATLADGVLHLRIPLARATGDALVAVPVERE